MDYNTLTLEDRLAQIKQRLPGLEQAHFNIYLDSVVGDADVAEPRMNEYREKIEELKALVDDLEAQIAARDSRLKPNK